MALYVKAKYDKSAILKKITNSPVFVKKGWIAAEKIAQRRFLESKRLFFREFLNHPVSKEIKAGPDAENTSGLLGGKGNLYSFFGFNAGEDPIGDVELYLSTAFGMTRGYYRNKQWTFRVYFPDEDKVGDYVVGKYGATYTSESWITGVEKGYSGLSYYVRFSGKGRSGGGFQSSKAVNALNFKTMQYFSEIVSNFKRNINK